MQKKQRRPGTASAAPPPPPPPPPPPAATATRLAAFWVTSNTAPQFPVSAGQKQIVKDTTHTQITTINNAGMVVGANAESTTPFASYDGLPALDARITAMVASQRAGGDLTIELHAAPWWMMGKPRDNNFSTVNNYSVLDANLTVWADFCAFIADRYWGQNVRNMIVWSELKGYSHPTLNRWDYERYTAMYNKVWTAVKAAKPLMKIGGPFTTTKCALEHYTGIPTVADDGSSIVSTTSVLGETWHFDARIMNVHLYWAQNAVGWDFKCFDMTIFQANTTATFHNNLHMAPATPWPVGTANTRVHADGTVVFDDREKPTLWGQWLDAVIPDGKPVWCIESYHGSLGTAADFQLMYDAFKAGGVDMMALWHGPNAPVFGSALWTAGTDTRTAVGNAAAAITAVVG